jgi:hypothetical protein
MHTIFRFPLLKTALLVGMVSLSGLSFAHSLLLTCRPAAGDMVRCVGEFSDGSDAAGIFLGVQTTRR